MASWSVVQQARTSDRLQGRYSQSPTKHLASSTGKLVKGIGGEGSTTTALQGSLEMEFPYEYDGVAPPPGK